MARFLHTADWQLGMVRHFFTPEVQGRYSAARLEGIRRIAEVADQESCDFVVVSGDVFEDNQLARSIVAQAIDALATFSVPVYLLPGNHDPLLSAGSVWDAAVMSSLPSNVYVLRDEQSIEVPGCEVEVVGAVWRSKHPNVDLVAETIASLEPTSRTRVLVGHGIVDLLSPDPNNPNLISVPTVESAIGTGLIQYLALGDRHSVTDVGSSGRIWYSGTQLVTNYVEVEPNHVLIVDVDRDVCRVEKRRVSNWAFVERHFEVMGDDVGEVGSWIDEIENKHQTVVKVSLSGSVSLAGKAIIDEALEMGADRLAAIEQWDRHSDLVVVPEDADFRDLGFGGFVEDAISELRDIVAGDGTEAGAADDALGLIIRLSRSGQ